MKIYLFSIKKFIVRSEGAALAMILIFIVILSLWMASIATLIRSGSSAIENNKQQNLYRAKIVNEVIPQALARLTQNGIRYGIDAVPSCGDVLNDVGFPISNGETAYIDCDQAPKSGRAGELASFVLTGGNCYIIPLYDCQPFNSSTRGEVGKDGGIKLDSSAAPLLVTGGIINVSGAWSNVSNSTLELRQLPGESLPKILQPSVTGLECPADSYIGSNNSAQVTRCTCPIPVTDPTQCPTGTDAPTFDLLNPLSTSTDLSNYLESISGTLADVSPTNLAKVPLDCTAPITVSVNSGIFYAVQISPGWVNSTLISRINNLMRICGDGSSASTPAVQFLPGIYRFDLAAIGTAINETSSTTNTLLINGASSGNGLVVVGGIPILRTTTGAPRWECDISKSGVQFQFQNASYMSMQRGYVSLCPPTNQPVLAAPSRTSNTSNAGNIAPFYWLGARSDPVFKNAGGTAGSGCTVCIDFNGLVFLPAGYLDLNYNGTTQMNFGKGIVSKALSVTGTGSAQSGGSVAPPPPFNGDRVVQFRISSTIGGISQSRQNLGVVQIVIRDYYGRRLSAGYKIISWRTLW
jgi:hypothetical protein